MILDNVAGQSDRMQTVDLAVRRLGLAEPRDCAVVRSVPIEVPVSIEVGGIGYAVMMATPSELEDYVLGFAISEGLVDGPQDMPDLTTHPVEGGWVARLSLGSDRMEMVLDRARRRVTESSCGLCGMDNIEQVLRPLPRVEARITTNRTAIARALGSLSDHQPLGRATGAVHVAAFCRPDGEIVLAREDVGRHNALDKLIGGLARAGIGAGEGFFLLSARCSYELVEKTVRAGCPMLVTISAPTSLAAERAAQAGLTLVTLARTDSALIVNDDHGMIE